MTSSSAFVPTEDVADSSDASLFPTFTAAQLERIGQRSTLRSLGAGDVVFRQGEPDLPFLVVLQGALVFYDENTPDRYHSRVAAGTFVGDVSVFTGAPSLATCIAAEPTQVLVADQTTLHSIVAESPDIGDLLLSAMLARRAWLEQQEYGSLQVLGPRSAETIRLQDFLQRNQVPFRWYDPETDLDSQRLLAEMSIGAEELPVVLSGGSVLRSADVNGVATALGLLPQLRTRDDDPYDVVVIGAGPAGLAAAVYAASEGLATLVLDDQGPGGQAGTSSKIENYLGFATGISGADLARQAVMQARKFGAEMSTPCAVTAVDRDDRGHSVVLSSGHSIPTRTVVLATGARYRRLPLDRLAHFEDAGVYYAARSPEALQCRGTEVLVVGGGNSAGQAAMFLTGHAARVHLAIRGDSLGAGMSDYLVRRLESSDDVEIHTGTNVTALHGDTDLEAVTLSTPDGDQDLPVSALFLMIGAVPRTDCIKGAGDISVDDNGFVLTGRAAKSPAADYEPLYLETSRAGVLAIGDVRSGSVKRVASAVGEGAMAVTLIHDLLGDNQ